MCFLDVNFSFLSVNQHKTWGDSISSTAFFADIGYKISESILFQMLIVFK